MLEMDPDKINNADRALEAKINEAADWYGESNARQKDENKGRAENRKRIADLGLSTKAYQWAVQLLKSGMTEAEIKDVLRDLEIFVRVLGGRQAELFPAELAAATKRRERQAEKAAKQGRTSEELDAAGEANPRSNPDAGGAGKKGRKGKAKAEPTTIKEAAAASDAALAESIAATEQQQGAEVLDSMLPKTHGADGKPLSQTAQAASIREQLGLDN